MNDRLRKQLIRENETDEQRSMRLLNKRLHTQIARETETEKEREVRQFNDRVHTQKARENETEEERRERLLNDRTHKEETRQQESEDEHRRRLAQQRERTANQRSNSIKRRKSLHGVNGDTRLVTEESNLSQTSVATSSSRRRMFQREQSMNIDQYIWPSAIPTTLKEKCLEEFSDRVSMSSLRQSICIICNSRVESSSMKEYPLEDISNLDYLSCHPDISNIISKIEKPVHGIKRDLIISQIIFMSF